MNDTDFLGMNLLPRGNRRWIVISMYGLLLAGGLAGRLGKAQQLNWLFLAGILALGLGLVAFLAVYRFTRRYAVRPSQQDHIEVDERESRVRDHAMAKAYTYLSATLVAVSGWMTVSSDDLRYWSPRTPHDWYMILSVFLVVTLTLPQAIITWSEPDQLPDLDGLSR